MPTKYIQVEQWNHPSCSEGLILTLEDGKTLDERRKHAADIFGTTPDDKTLVFSLRDMSAKQIKELPEFPV